MKMNEAPAAKVELRNVRFNYGSAPILNGVTADFSAHCITAVVGPSGQGKTTLLMTLNRLWQEERPIVGRLAGTVRIHLNGGMVDIYQDRYDLTWLRRRVGMVFQSPNPLPMSIYKNVAFPLKLAGENRDHRMEERVQSALRQAFLWDEVKDRLHKDARELSGGQQQRLCIARALILRPEVLLLDEPTSSLDRRACEVIEALLAHLKESCTMVMVSHYLEQVRRIADRVMVMENGRLLPQTAA